MKLVQQTIKIMFRRKYIEPVAAGGTMSPGCTEIWDRGAGGSGLGFPASNGQPPASWQAWKKTFYRNIHILKKSSFKTASPILCNFAFTVCVYIYKYVSFWCGFREAGAVRKEYTGLLFLVAAEAQQQSSTEQITWELLFANKTKRFSLYRSSYFTAAAGAAHSAF